MKSDDLKSGPKKLKTASEHGIQAPLALLAELSHRCPLQCPYCSNPVQLEKKTGELTTEEWKSDDKDQDRKPYLLQPTASVSIFE